MDFQGRIEGGYSSVPYFQIPPISICLLPISFNFTNYFLTSSTLTLNAGKSKTLPLHENESTFPAIPNHFHTSIFTNQLPIHNHQLHRNGRPIPRESRYSGVFFVERLLGEANLPSHYTPNVLNSTELSEVHIKEMTTVSSVNSSESKFSTFDLEPTFPYGFKRRTPIVPSSFNDLNLSPNPFIILATMAVVQPTTLQAKEIAAPYHRCRQVFPQSQRHQ